MMRNMNISMNDREFLKYWLYAAFPGCYGLQQYLSKNIPSTYCYKRNQHEITVAGQEITIWMYCHHVEYRSKERELYMPCLSYDAVNMLDNDAYLLLLPIVDMATCDYRSEHVLPDLKRRLSETALPREHVEEVAYDICCGLVDGDGAEDEPLWMIWDESEKRRYGAFWWQDAQELQLYAEDDDIPSVYITAPQRDDASLFDWARKMLSEWILKFV